VCAEECVCTCVNVRVVCTHTHTHTECCGVCVCVCVFEWASVSGLGCVHIGKHAQLVHERPMHVCCVVVVRAPNVHG
jgi:hypothetical protein